MQHLLSSFFATLSTIDIWPGLAPSEAESSPGQLFYDGGSRITRLTDVTQPQVVYGPRAEAARPAVLVLPGGGYHILAADLEGSETWAWLEALGFAAFVLHYRVPERRDGAFQDAQRALSLLRANAETYGIDPSRLGVLGFSAGGHLAARLSSGYGTQSYPPVRDAADGASCRPDFTMLVYPAYLMDPETGKVAAEVRPHSEMPPVFVTQARDDPHFSAEVYADALEAAGVPVTQALYHTGGHGYGHRLPPEAEAAAWPAEAGAWLQAQAGR